MKKIIFTYLFLFIIIFVSLQFIQINIYSFVSIYACSMRNTFFLAFLTVGSFVFSLMTFFLFNLKEKLFDNDKYVEMLDSLRHYFENRINKYEKLINISKGIFFTVLSCFITSFCQLSVGLIENITSTSICISLAICTLLLFLYLLLCLYNFLDIWFRLLNTY